MSPGLKRNVIRVLLFFHLLGLGVSVGTRAADFLLDRMTGGGNLQVLVLGRIILDASQRFLTAPAFLLLVVTGLAMAWLQYGRKPPIWVWIKLGVAVVIGAIAVPVLAPLFKLTLVLERASLAQGQLDPRVPELLTRGNVLGGIVLALFLVNMVVALWRPFMGRRRAAPASASRASPSPPPH